MFYVLSGFVFGCLIPYIARRFAKFMPATFAYALVEIFRAGKRLSSAKRQDERYAKLKNKFLWRSFVWGIVTATLSAAALWRFGANGICWYLFFIWSLLLMTEIDWRMFLLPDILTVPLLIVGFVCASFVADWTFAADSALGAAVGYFMPVLATLLLVWKDKDMFGGGDIKLLAAIGAWFGVEKLIYTILLSVVFFVLYAVLWKKHSGAYGPAAAVAAIVVAFYFF